MDIFVERTNRFNAIFMAGTSIELSGFVIPRSSITLCCLYHKDDKDRKKFIFQIQEKKEQQQQEQKKRPILMKKKWGAVESKIYLTITELHRIVHFRSTE